MSLLVYREVSTGVFEAYTSDGDLTNPITSVFDGRVVNVEVLHLYVGADDSNAYTNITMKPESQTEADDIGSGTDPGITGWGVKIMVDGGYTPTESDWDNINYGNTIAFNSITSSYNNKEGFWLRLESPAGQIVQNKTNIVLTLMYTETA